MLTLTWADILFEKLRPEPGEYIWKTPLGWISIILTYFMGEVTPQLFYQNYLLISGSFGVKRVLSYALHNIPSY